MTETHTIGEREFAERIGVARSVVAKIRADQLEESTDFKKSGREILLTHAGASRLTELLAAPKKKEGAVEELTQEAASALTLFVVRIPVNRRVVIATDRDPKRWASEGAGVALIVRVRDNQLFIPRMELQAKPSERNNTFTLVGRCPRWKGKY
jgi:hypothetical protein